MENNSENKNRKAFSTIYFEILHSVEFKKLKPSSKIVYLYLRSYSNLELKSVYPGIQKLEEDTYLDRRTIYRSIDELSQNNFIKIVKTNKNNEYYFELEQKIISKDKFVNSSEKSRKNVTTRGQICHNKGTKMSQSSDKNAVSSNIITRSVSKSKTIDIDHGYNSKITKSTTKNSCKNLDMNIIDLYESEMNRLSELEFEKTYKKIDFFS